VLVEVKKTVRAAHCSSRLKLKQGICGSDVHCSCPSFRDTCLVDQLEVYLTTKLGLMEAKSPMCLGHESSGYVARLGANVAAKAAEAEKFAAELAKASGGKGSAKSVVRQRVFNIGDKVTLEPSQTCRMCSDCINGQYQVSRAFRAFYCALMGIDMRAYVICSLPACRRYPATILQAVRCPIIALL